jgi:uncharacterized protein YndB with AHSA1/START domain
MSANQPGINTLSDLSKYDLVITRVFDAPRKLVFKAWTDPAQVASWSGPNGFTNKVHELDARAGGTMRVDMIAPDGTVFPMIGTFQEITEPERLVFVSGALNENGKPLFEVLTTVTFTEQRGQTTLTMQARVTSATAGAAQHLKGMEVGWSQTLDRLGRHVESLGSAEAVKPAIALVEKHADSNQAKLSGDREIVATRVVDAPRETVWKVWTDPKHLTQWWGPQGFSTTTHEMQVKAGGEWRFIMHGPDGRNYPNRIVYSEVVKPERLVYKHVPEKDGEQVRFEVTVNFADEGAKTRIHFRMLFPTGEERDRIVKAHHAVEGLTQTLARLADHLSAGAAAESNPTEFVITREFNAPRELVFKAWTEAERLARWWGPKGCAIEVRALEVRPGGVFHYVMRLPNGQAMWGKFVYREVASPERMVFVSSFSDESGATTRSPYHESWPLEVLNAMTLAERDGKTTLTLRGGPINSTEQERKVFQSFHESMQKGFGGTFDQLEEYLASL